MIVTINEHTLDIDTNSSFGRVTMDNMLTLLTYLSHTQEWQFTSPNASYPPIIHCSLLDVLDIALSDECTDDCTDEQIAMLNTLYTCLIADNNPHSVFNNNMAGEMS